MAQRFQSNHEGALIDRIHAARMDGPTAIVINPGGLTLAYNGARVAGATTIAASGTAGFSVASSTSGSLTSDYSFTAPTVAAVNGTITAKALTASAVIGGATSQTYDGTTSASGASVSGTVSGAIGGDTLTLNTSGLTLA